MCLLLGPKVLNKMCTLFAWICPEHVLPFTEKACPNFLFCSIRFSIYFGIPRRWSSSKRDAIVCLQKQSGNNLSVREALTWEQADVPLRPLLNIRFTGKPPGYLPTSEAITVMLCQEASSLSRGRVVRMSPLPSSILKYLIPSSLLSK